MTSLEGVPHHAVTVPELRISVTGGTPYRPVLTLANGTPMARRSSERTRRLRDGLTTLQVAQVRPVLRLGRGLRAGLGTPRSGAMRWCCCSRCCSGYCQVSCSTLVVVTAILTTLLGGFLAIAGGLVGIAIGDRRERSRWLRDSQWQASTNLLSALQLMIRRMINVSYLDEKDSVDPASAVVASFSEATVAWNSALYGALLIAPPGVAGEIPKLDREVDRLLDLAVSRQWTRKEFREERVRLGRMAAEYLRLARKLAGLPDIELSSIWAWDDGEEHPGQGRRSPDGDALRPTA